MIDGTGEIARPEPVPETKPQPELPPEPAAAVQAELPVDAQPELEAEPVWRPDFDTDDDLNGLLEVKSPLLARAFRGTGRRR